MSTDQQDWRHEPSQPKTSQTRHDVFIPPHLAHDPLNDITPGNEQSKPAHTIHTAERKQRHQKKRKKQSSRRRTSRGLGKVWLGALILIVLIGWAVLRFAAIPFGTITVRGNEHLDTKTVIAASGVYGYTNVVQLSPEDMQYRLNHDLRIAQAEVKRSFPATIQVTIKERQVAAVIATMYGFAYVDKNGTVMDIQPQIKDVSVPILTGKRVDTLLLGDVITDSAIHGSLVYLQHVTPDVAAQIAEINVGNPENIIVYTVDSLPIHLGTGDNPEERAAITVELLQQVQDNHVNAQYIDTDVRAPFVKTK